MSHHEARRESENGSVIDFLIRASNKHDSEENRQVNRISKIRKEIKATLMLFSCHLLSQSIFFLTQCIDPSLTGNGFFPGQLYDLCAHRTEAEIWPEGLGSPCAY